MEQWKMTMLRRVQDVGCCPRGCFRGEGFRDYSAVSEIREERKLSWKKKRGKEREGRGAAASEAQALLREGGRNRQGSRGAIIKGGESDE